MCPLSVDAIHEASTLSKTKAGGVPIIAWAKQVNFWGALAMALTAGVGALRGVVAG
ncbi:hypothetical protein KUC_2207 [Vreelandella boliviensis LC1]|uniref:Uncharacterized protein n=1 Tax=Vreelandella boliviensis LC1 TaxID=1072583 RepID=A0A7U9C285_9GAMM|nr:hypothetical protein KUC_2207 [Halomonas boliviensis LC1]